MRILLRPFIASRQLVRQQLNKKVIQIKLRHPFTTALVWRAMEDKEALKKRLTPLQYHVTQEAGTERPYTGCYNKFYEEGMYVCVVCRQDLFSSKTKFDSGCGWPAFNDCLAKDKVTLHQDTSAVLRQDKQIKSTAGTHYFTIDHELVYENYFADFGPLNLGCVYKYCKLLNDKLKIYLNKQAIVHYTSSNPKKSANAAFLMGCYGVLHLGLSPRDAMKPLTMNGTISYRPFQDATEEDSIYTITILDCLKAIKKARDLGLYNIKDFNFEDYNRLDKIAGGDLNWIIPGKILAFIGPVDVYYCVNLYHPPDMYINYFLDNNVRVVIRLNKKLYDGNVFRQAGIAHYDMFFPDGSCPPKHILCKFLQICENTDGAIAVHCKAGLGRTGSLIGSYLIKHYRMTAREAIGWMRICRPGSVIGPQQAWKKKYGSKVLEKGNHSPPPPIQWDNRSDILLPERPRASKLREAVNKPQKSREHSAEMPKDRIQRALNKGDQTERSRSTTRRGGDAGENPLSTSVLAGSRTIAMTKTRSSFRGRINDSSSSKKDMTYTGMGVRNVKASRPKDSSPSPVRASAADRKRISAKSKEATNNTNIYERLNHIYHTLTVIPNNPNRVVPVASDNNATAIYSTAASRGSIQSGPRRRLGRSPSPSPSAPAPATRVGEHSRATNTPSISSIKTNGSRTLMTHNSKTSLKKVLSRLKYGPVGSDSRRGSIGGHSFGANSLDARRNAPTPVRQRSPRVHSDERAVATQGDMLNSIKIQRRLPYNSTFNDKFNRK